MRLRERDRFGDEVLARMLRETDLTAQRKETPCPGLDRQPLKQNAACGFIDWVSAAVLGQQGGSEITSHRHREWSASAPRAGHEPLGSEPISS